MKLILTVLIVFLVGLASSIPRGPLFARVSILYCYQQILFCVQILIFSYMLLEKCKKFR